MSKRAKMQRPGRLYRLCDYCGAMVRRELLWPMIAEREDEDQVEMLVGRFCGGCREHLRDMGYALGSA